MEDLLEKRLKTEEIVKKSVELLPGGVNSPARSFPDVDLLPLIVQEGKGDAIFDVDGRKMIDYCMSWGVLILGHAKKSMVDAATKAIQKGSSFGIHTQIETQIAEKVCALVPAIEKVRFVNSGTEATSTAIRLARGYTSRNMIVKFNGNYHGHVDSLLVKAGSGVMNINEEATSKGIPKDSVKDTLCLEYNDIEGVKELFSRTEYEGKIAAVIFEPVSGNMGVIPADPEFLKVLREETEKAGALLIADEVITGFRVALGGASDYFGIKPDLITLGKIIGGGFPVAAIGGKREIMDCLAPTGEVYQAGTLSGNPVAMSAGFQTLSEISEPGFYENLKAKTDILTKPIQEKLKGTPHSLVQVGSMFSLFFNVKNPKTRHDLDQMDLDLFKKFFAYLFKNGVYIPPSAFETWFVSSAHTEEHLTYTRDVILSFFGNSD